MSEPARTPDRSRSLWVGASAAALLFASVLVALHSEADYRSQATEAARAQARVLAETVTAALSFGDRAALQQYVDALRANEDVDAVGVFDAGGRLTAGFTRSRLADRLSQTIHPEAASDRVIVFAPVTEKGVALGTVYLRDRTEPLGRRFSRYAGAALLVVMASLMFVVMGFDGRALRRANRALLAQMGEREKAEAALRQSQKMEAVGRLTGGIAHDFNNMLAMVIGSLDLLQRRRLIQEPDGGRLVQNALEGAHRAASLTQRLLAFSRLQPLKPTSVDVYRCVADITDLLVRTLGETITIETVSGGGLWRAQIDPSQLESAIVNLAINARDAMPHGGKLTLECANTYLDRSYASEDLEVSPGQYVMLAITDTGSGIPPEIINQVFEPFFTTKPEGRGTGLGLSQVHGFIKQSGGHIRIYSEVGVGTTVKLYLPRSTVDADAPEPVAARKHAGSPRGITVLLVEDEAGVRAFAEEALMELGYDVVSAPDAKTALRLLGAHPEIALVLTDVVMPEINGRILAEQARAKSPNLKIVFMTGYTRNAIVHNGMLDAGMHLVSKPFTLAQLAVELEAALGSQT
jgi:signal transduction histidine kinase